MERRVYGIKHSNETFIKSSRKVLRARLMRGNGAERPLALRQNAQKQALLGAEFGNIAQKLIEI